MKPNVFSLQLSLGYNDENPVCIGLEYNPYIENEIDMEVSNPATKEKLNTPIDKRTASLIIAFLKSSYDL